MRHVKKSLLLIFLWAIAMASHATQIQLPDLKDEEGSAFAGRYSACGILEAYAAEERKILAERHEPTAQQRGQLQTLAWQTVRRMAQHTGLSTIENRVATPGGQMRTSYYFGLNPDWVKNRLADLQKQNSTFRAQNTAMQSFLGETAKLAQDWTQYDMPTAPLLHASSAILEEQMRLRQTSQAIADTEIQRIKAWQDAAAPIWQRQEFEFGSGNYSQKRAFFLPPIDPTRPIVGYVSEWDARKLASGALQRIWASLLPHLETQMAGHFTIGNPRPPVAEPEVSGAVVSADGAGGSGSSSSANAAGTSNPDGAEDDDDTEEEEKAADA